MLAPPKTGCAFRKYTVTCYQSSVLPSLPQCYGEECAPSLNARIQACAQAQTKFGSTHSKFAPCEQKLPVWPSVAAVWSDSLCFCGCTGSNLIYEGTN